MLDDATASRRRPHLTLVAGKQVQPGRSPRATGTKSAAAADIREARSREEKDQLFRLRYQIYLDAPGCDLRDVDHRRGRIEDETDANSVNLLAYHRSSLVGAVQLSYCWMNQLGTDEDFYRMREAAGLDHPSNTSILSRLMVAPAWRGRGLSTRLCIAACRQALKANMRVVFIRCADPLIFFFSELGFKAYMGRTIHREYGQVVPMKLDLLDEKYLMMIRSPLLPTLREWKQSRQSGIRIVPA